MIYFILQRKAYWIALKVIKYAITVTDNLIIPIDQNTMQEFEEIKQIIFDHFKVIIY